MPPAMTGRRRTSVWLSCIDMKLFLTAALIMAAAAAPAGQPEDLAAAASLFPKDTVLKRQWAAASSNDLLKLKTDLKIQSAPPYLLYYEGRLAGTNQGRAVIHTVGGKHGPIRLMVLLNSRGIVAAMTILSHRERRGRGIVKRSFTAQFVDKTPQGGFRLGDDIQGITGATVSSRAVADGVKLVAVYMSVVMGEETK